MRIRFIVLYIMFCVVNSAAQSVIRGHITDVTTGHEVIGAYVTLFDDHGISKQTVSNDNGHYSMTLFSGGTYDLDVTAIGYESLIRQVAIENDTIINVGLTPMSSVELGDVTVIADKSEIITRMANGDKYYLSSEAKKRRNPFMALEEIPVLVSDPVTATLRTLDGKTPLILINGNRINSGISPVLAEEIESVDVITQVSARYLQEGYTTIVNINVKPKKQPYTWVESSVTADCPVSGISAMAGVEAGNKQYSIYGGFAPDFVIHSDNWANVERCNTGYYQEYTRHNRHDKQLYPVDILFKAHPDQNNYYALQFTVAGMNETRRGHGNGEFNDGIYKLDAAAFNESSVASVRAYWKHSFNRHSGLELYGDYTHCRDSYDSSSTDIYDSRTVENASHYLTHGNLISLYADYSITLPRGGVIEAGSSLKINHYRLRDYTLSAGFANNCINEYLYAGFTHKISRIMYMVSCGVEFIRFNTRNIGNSYFRPRGSVSATWLINSGNSLRLSYDISNTAPSLSQLNPLNTSTDSMTVSTGNPLLKPQMTRNLMAQYMWNYRKLYVRGGMSYAVATDMFDSWGYTIDGIYHNTIINSGRYSRLLSSVDFSYRLPDGRIFLGCRLKNEFYRHTAPKNSFTVWGGMNIILKKWMLAAYIEYTNKEYGALYNVSFTHPTSADLRILYSISPDIQIGAGLRNFTGQYERKTVTTNGSYYHSSTMHYTEKNIRPWFHFRYTFRRNHKNKMDFDGIPSKIP